MLTDAVVGAAKAYETPYKLTDAGGLVLFVAPNGSKHWRMRYVFLGKEKLLSFGPYPKVGLAQAREQRDAAKALLRDGKDPSLEKKLRRPAATWGASRPSPAIGIAESLGQVDSGNE